MRSAWTGLHWFVSIPLGVQITGFEGEDERLAAIARMLLEAFGAPTVGPG